jgi:hypothetical protein
MGIAAANYIIYAFYPIPLGLPRILPWPYLVSALLAILIAIPSGYLMLRGIRDAGEEAMIPKKEHTLYRGIYEKSAIRKPWTKCHSSG